MPDNYLLDVYLTDDGCTDGTPDAIRTDFPKVNIIQGDGSLFWNRGMYAAWSEAEKNNYDYYLWLNDDTFLFQECIRSLLEESNINNNQAIVVGATMDSKRSSITYGGWNGNKLLVNLDGPNRCVDHFNGNIVLIPKLVYDVVGKNDPYFHHALGDFDYGLRATEAGIRSIVCDKPLGICDLHESIPKWKNPDLSLLQRWKALYSVGGNGANPKEYFYYQRKHRGWIRGGMTFITNHVHVIIPWIWRNRI